ncbi:MAG: DHA2 family efflux MFS transporter permease subunit [Steroidobacteraceae bacterium]
MRVAGASAGAGRKAGLHRLVLSTATTFATLLYAIDITVANVALPTIQGNMAATREQVSWIITSYLVASATTLPALGAVTARLGLRRAMLWSVLGFGLASAACGLAPNIGFLVVARFAQGLFGAALIPLAQTALQNEYQGPELPKAFAMLGAGVMFGPVIGPTVGGWVTSEISWRAVFYLNVPFVALATLGLMATLRGDPEPSPRRFDHFGFTLLCAALVALQLSIDRGETLGWLDSSEIVVEFAVVTLASWMFVVHSFTASRPLVDRSLLRNRNMLVALLISVLIGWPLTGSMLMSPAFLQEVQGYPVIDAGSVLAARGVGFMASMYAAGRFANRVGLRLQYVVGCLLSAVGLYGQSQATADVAAGWLAGWLIVQGLGLGLLFVPLNTLAFATLPPPLRTEAAAIVTLARNIGSGVGVAFLVRSLGRDSREAAGWLLEQAHWRPGDSLDASFAWFSSALQREAAVIAYSRQYRQLALMALVMLPLILLMTRPAAGEASRPGIVEA